jgi:hypothetical protein
MDEKDVWALSPSMQSRPVFIKFTTIRYGIQCIPVPPSLKRSIYNSRSSLLRRLWAANSLDLMYGHILSVARKVSILPLSTQIRFRAHVR